jgi:hypothetical protein
VEDEQSPRSSGSENKTPDALSLPAQRPKIVPLRFGRTADNRYGLFVRNDGEPAFDISMEEPVGLGNAKLKFWDRTYSGLTTEEGELFIDSKIEVSSGYALTASALRDEMTKAGLDTLALRIRYRDLDSRSWVTKFEIVCEFWGQGLRVSAVRQELI